MIQSLDERRNIVIPTENTLHYCVDQFFQIGEKSLSERGRFIVALSGGSTPKAIYQLLTDSVNRKRIDWKKVFLFWSDERQVPPYDPESNYRMAMDAGFEKVGVLPQQIFRMQAEGDIEEGALAYEALIKKNLPDGKFDLIMLGMGEDGHTASLFPKTHGLHTTGRLAIANYVPPLKTWRMTLTFECINAAHQINVYILGANKAEVVKKVLASSFDPDMFPIQAVGLPENRALWILDQAAAALLQ